jgi:hypothetical protein
MDAINRRQALKLSLASTIVFAVEPAGGEMLYDPELAAMKRAYESDTGTLTVRRDEHGTIVFVITN